MNPSYRILRKSALQWAVRRRPSRRGRANYSAGMARSSLLPLPDYQRVYQVIYSVLQASGIATTSRACVLFASAGATLLREHYGLPATISAGCMALMVEEAGAQVVVYGRKTDNGFVADIEAFHAWVECDGWLIDFMAPIMGIALRADGHDWQIPRRMLQRRLADRLPSPGDIQHQGEFSASHDAALAEVLLDRQSVQFEDLLNVCQTWFRRPPKPLKPLAMADSHGPTKKLVLQAPSIDGVW